MESDKKPGTIVYITTAFPTIDEAFKKHCKFNDWWERIQESRAGNTKIKDHYHVDETVESVLAYQKGYRRRDILAAIADYQKRLQKLDEVFDTED